MKPILCYLLHAWRVSRHESGSYVGIAYCERCGAEKKWARRKDCDPEWLKVRKL